MGVVRVVYFAGGLADWPHKARHQFRISLTFYMRHRIGVVTRFAMLYMLRVTVCLGAASWFLAACATLPDDPVARTEVEAQNDPFEPANRAIFSVNQAVDHNFINPVIGTYVDVVPVPAQKGLRNALSNLRAPLTFVNDVLQWHWDGAAETTSRFVVNSTLGVLGLFDFADDHLGIPGHEEDFGQTFAVWGIPEGPYLILPLFGPTTARDLSGSIVEYFADPTDIAFDRAGASELIWPRAIAEEIDNRASRLIPTQRLESASLDYYAALRSAYRQVRTDEINSPQAQDAPRQQVPTAE